MTEEEKKYERVLNILRKSKPELNGLEDIEKGVLKEIQKSGRKVQEDFNLFDYLFGWVYIGWVRTTLITVSIFFVGLFLYQNTLILRRLNLLENQTVTTGSQFVNLSPVNQDYNITVDRRTKLRLKTGKVAITRKQLEELVNSYNDMENKYKNLIHIIEDDPELKQMYEKKLSEKNKKKFNL
ncbi:MAG: hypothetical protein NT092_09380 [Bacteroidia bacterium]|nr:hypothetical protein [Bacteroidia bacterium]